MNFSFAASYSALWALVVFQGLLIVALLRQLSELKRFVERGGLPQEDWLPAGSPAPAFSGTDLRSGRKVTSATFGPGVVLFLSPRCDACNELADSLRRVAERLPPPIIAICRGEEHACSDFLARLNPDVPVLWKGVEEVAAKYGVGGTPTAVVVDGGHKIRAYGHPKDIEDLTRLLTRSLAEDPDDNSPGVKERVPVLSSGESLLP